MGYACPVCEVPQFDARHLANHLAFTAILGDDDHEAWLDEQTPDWETVDEATLAEKVGEYATEREFPQAFEDTTRGNDGPGADRSDVPRSDDPYRHRWSPNQPSNPESRGGSSESVEAILEEARELTARRRSTAESTDEND